MRRPGTGSSSGMWPPAGSMNWQRRRWATYARDVAPTGEPPREPKILARLSPPAGRGPAVGRLLLRTASSRLAASVATLEAGRPLLVGSGRPALSRGGGRRWGRSGLVLDRDTRGV